VVDLDARSEYWVSKMRLRQRRRMGVLLISN
jgi:hypothetical protein